MGHSHVKFGEGTNFKYNQYVNISRKMNSMLYLYVQNMSIRQKLYETISRKHYIFRKTNEDKSIDIIKNHQNELLTFLVVFN